MARRKSNKKVKAMIELITGAEYSCLKDNPKSYTLRKHGKPISIIRAINQRG